jgi:hypothetical protein
MQLYIALGIVLPPSPFEPGVDSSAVATCCDSLILLFAVPLAPLIVGSAGPLVDLIMNKISLGACCWAERQRHLKILALGT